MAMPIPRSKYQQQIHDVDPEFTENDSLDKTYRTDLTIDIDIEQISSISMSNETEEDQLNRINLQALQNRDPYITKILDQAQRVCVYKFLADKRQWERKDLEGTLFVYERSCEPRHGFSILSTVSRETFVQIIKASMEFKHSPNHDAFLQYKVDVGDIFGLWFISKPDCPRVTETLKNLTSQAKTSFSTLTSIFSSSQTSDIYSLLVNAQEKFQESKRQNETNSGDPTGPLANPLLRLFASQDATTMSNGSSPSTHEEREQELKKTLGIGAKPALSVTELEKQFLQQKSFQESTSSNGRLMTPADFQNLFIPSSSSSVNPFSKDVLRQLLVNLLKNDDEFLVELHNAYASKQQRFHHF